MREIGIALLAILLAPATQEGAGRGGQEYRLVFKDPAAFALSRANTDTNLAATAAAQYLEEHSLESLIEYFETHEGHRLNIRRLCDRLLKRYLEQEKWDEAIGLAEKWAAADPEFENECLAYLALAYRGSGQTEAAEQNFRQLMVRIQRPDFILNTSGSLPSLLAAWATGSLPKPGDTREKGPHLTAFRSFGDAAEPIHRVAPSPVDFRLGKGGNVLQIRWVHKESGHTEAIAIAIQLTELEQKKQRFTLNLIVDGSIPEKKGFNAGQPIVFEARGATQPYVILVSAVGKDWIKGSIARSSPVGRIEFDFYTPDGRLIGESPRLLWLPPPLETDAISAKDSASTEEILYTADKVVVDPVLMHRTLPGYTQAASKAEVQGPILLQVVVWKDGSVDIIRIVKSLGFWGLDESTIEEIANNWRFRPGTIYGKPVSAAATVEVLVCENPAAFALSESDKDFRLAATAAAQYLVKHSLESLIEYFESRQGNRFKVRELCEELLDRYLEQEKWDEEIGLAERWSIAEPQFFEASLTNLARSALAYRGKGDAAAAEQSLQQLIARTRQPGFTLNQEHMLPRLLTKLGVKVEEPVDPQTLRAPRYTDAAIRAKVEGIVLLSVLIGAGGKVQDIVILKGLGYGLDKAAVRLTEKSQFEPARVEGRAVQFRAIVEFTFRLK